MYTLHTQNGYNTVMPRITVEVPVTLVVEVESDEMTLEELRNVCFQFPAEVSRIARESIRHGYGPTLWDDNDKGADITGFADVCPADRTGRIMVLNEEGTDLRLQ